MSKVYNGDQQIKYESRNLENIITHEFSLNQLETAIRTASDVEHSGNVVIKFEN